MDDFKEHIALCFELIEKKLSRGSRDTWDTHDFRLLGESIQRDTGTLLSVSTLKRLSGKVSYSSKPNNTTLNALAKYIGFKDWRTFRNGADLTGLSEKTRPSRKKWAKYLVPILVFTFVGLLIFLFDQNRETYSPDDFIFNSRPVGIGIPNSVVFDYDASAADDDSKIEIQQYWDESKRMTIGREDSVATSIYYHPGFFKSKLIVDDSVVKENDVFITTEDWLGMIEQEPRPIYLGRSDIMKDGIMAITPEVVSAHNLDPRTSEIAVSFYQVRDFGELYTNNFEMAVTLKNDFEEGVSGACQRAVVYILYDGGAIGVPLSKKGCVSELTLMTFEKFLDGKKTDLSDFGVDFTDYVELKCISRDQNLDIFLDNRLVFSFDVPEIPKKIVGISIQFEGAGSVENVSFRNNERIVYDSGT